MSANSENMSSNLKVYRKNESTKKTNPLRFMSGNTNKISHSMNNSMNATGKLNRTADVSLNIGQNNNN